MKYICSSYTFLNASMSFASFWSLFIFCLNSFPYSSNSCFALLFLFLSLLLCSFFIIISLMSSLCVLLLCVFVFYRFSLSGDLKILRTHHNIYSLECFELFCRIVYILLSLMLSPLNHLKLSRV